MLFCGIFGWYGVGLWSDTMAPTPLGVTVSDPEGLTPAAAQATENAAMEDFDLEGMIHHLGEAYSDVPQEEIRVFVPFAVYLYYLR